mgnify:CR=1 FL=1
MGCQSGPTLLYFPERMQKRKTQPIKVFRKIAVICATMATECIRVQAIMVCVQDKVLQSVDFLFNITQIGIDKYIHAN